MEQWPKPCILPSQTEAERHNHHHRLVRVLGDTSGNVQSYAQDFKPGLENQVSIHDIPDLRVPGSNNGQYHFLPVPTLPSNDQKDANLARLHTRHRRREPNHGFRRRFDDDRPYLKCLKYTEYRQRRRQDTGEDGKPVWDDPMEEAFQNGL
jgi:transcriptional enhancer factor